MSGGDKKRPIRGSVLDKVPVFGILRRTRGWIRRHRGWIYLALIVVILFIVRPVLELIAQIVKVFAPAVEAIFANPIGRFLFYNVLAVALLWFLWRKVRGGVRRVFGLTTMRSFLDGMNLMILGRWRPAIPAFEKVVHRSRWLRLEDAVPEHRDIAADARVKIATCFFRLGRANEALRWLHTVREQDILTEHVRRNHAELRALTYDLSDELEEETILKELERTQGKDKTNRRILLALKERHEAAGNLEGARNMTRRLVQGSEGPEREETEHELARLEFQLAHKALESGQAAGSRKGLQRALKVHPGDVRSALLLGDLQLEEGDVRGALKSWSRAVSLPVFERLERLLESGRLAGDKEMDLLVRQFPYAGTLLVLAEHHRKRGETRKARSAVEKVLDAAGESFPALRIYAACLEEEGESDRAQELYRRALSLSLA